MALIQVGTVSDFALRTLEPSGAPDVEVDVGVGVAVREERFDTLGEVVTSAQADQYGAVITDSPRGLAVSKILLRPGLRDWLSRFLHRSVPVYFLAWAWDLSGNPIEVYPAAVGREQNCTIPVGKKIREVTFMGAGAPLFQPRQVHAGIALRVQLWQSRGGTRSVGSTLGEVARVLNSRELRAALVMLAAGTGVPGAALGTVVALAGQAAEGVGNVLKESGDRFIDYFEGYFPASDPWSAGEDGPHVHDKTEITLRRLA